MKLQWTETAHKRMGSFADAFGNVLVDAFHYLALFAIGGAIVWSASIAFFGMASKGHASIEDIRGAYESLSSPYRADAARSREIAAAYRKAMALRAAQP